MKKILSLSFVACVPNLAWAGVISDAPSLADVLLNVLDFVLSIVGIIAILSLALSGVLYIASGGDASQAEKAKRYAGASVIGLLIALGALIIVRQIGKLI
ncbi:MAG: hypothetical protein KA731_02050 [Candidatus Moranbacteria bacterium]|nr:hypothetical protein [Candidatus Moranbacteria bacterium]MBP7696012.1 hypothetical protein [Candidatus Moranbacteria bacterium]